MSQPEDQLPNLRKPLSRTLPPPPSTQGSASDAPSAFNNPDHPDYIPDDKLGMRCGALKRKIGTTLKGLDNLLALIDELKSSSDAAKQTDRLGKPF